MSEQTGAKLATTLCGPEGLEVRLGDHRYNNRFGFRTLPRRLAVMVPHVDPLTGKVVASDAYIYGAGYERAAAFDRDMIRLLSGDLEQTDYVNGSDLAIQIEAANQRYNEQRSELTLEQVTRSVRTERSGCLNVSLSRFKLASRKPTTLTTWFARWCTLGCISAEHAWSVTAAAVALMEGSESQEEFERFNALDARRRIAERKELRLRRAGAQAIDFSIFSDDAMLQLARRLRSKPELQTNGQPDYDKIRPLIMKMMFVHGSARNWTHMPPVITSRGSADAPELPRWLLVGKSTFGS